MALGQLLILPTTLRAPLGQRSRGNLFDMRAVNFCSFSGISGNCIIDVVMDDDELLRQYVQDRSQEAFRQLVERHLGMVFATARRMAGDAHLAEEIAQNVFTTLAQKGAAIRPPQILSG